MKKNKVVWISETREGYQIIKNAEKNIHGGGYDLNGKEVNKEDLIGFKIKDIYDDSEIFLILECDEKDN